MWEKIDDERYDECFTHEDYGNVVRDKGGEEFYSLIPALFQLGPFKSALEAQQASAYNYDIIVELTTNMNREMLDYIDTLRKKRQ